MSRLAYKINVSAAVLQTFRCTQRDHNKFNKQTGKQVFVSLFIEFIKISRIYTD